MLADLHEFWYVRTSWRCKNYTSNCFLQVNGAVSGRIQDRSIYYLFHVNDKIITLQKKVAKGDRDILYRNLVGRQK